MKNNIENKEEINETGKKSAFKERLVDSLLELVIAAAAFAIGLGILVVLGFKNVIADWDPEIVILVGVLAILAVIGTIIGVVALIKKKKK